MPTCTDCVLSSDCPAKCPYGPAITFLYENEVAAVYDVQNITLEEANTFFKCDELYVSEHIYGVGLLSMAYSADRFIWSLVDAGKAQWNGPAPERR
jgi:hypothetical protein